MNRKLISGSLLALSIVFLVGCYNKSDKNEAGKTTDKNNPVVQIENISDVKTNIDNNRITFDVTVKPEKGYEIAGTIQGIERNSGENNIGYFYFTERKSQNKDSENVKTIPIEFQLVEGYDKEKLGKVLVIYDKDTYKDPLDFEVQKQIWKAE
jgi:hypothetical protein